MIKIIFLCISMIWAFPGNAPVDLSREPLGANATLYDAWISTIKMAIADKQWSKLNAADWIGHDKFNIADGLDVDMFIIEELQLKGDPIRGVIRRITEERDAEEEKLKQKQKRGRFSNFF